MGYYTVPQSPRFDKVNLLEEWVNAANILSSPYNPRPLYERSLVISIENTLRNTFPDTFYIHKYGNDGVVRDVNPIKRYLISPDKIGVTQALYELCLLIEYTRDRQPALFNEVKSNMYDAVKFQAILYEAFIAQRLELFNVNYKCDMRIHGRPLDGSFLRDGQQYRVECKQPFAPNSDELETLRRVVERVHLVIHRVDVRCGFGITLRLKRPAQPSILTEANGLITNAIHKLAVERVKTASVLTSPSGKFAIDLLPLGALDPGTRSTENELVARVEVDPEQRTSTGGVGYALYKFSFSYKQSQIIDRLRNIVKAARKQHHDRTHEKLIICVDSQELDDFRLGMFQATNFLEDPITIRRIQSVLNKCIVLVTRRIYNPSGATLKSYVFNEPEDQAMADFLKSAFTAQRRWGQMN
jgi:hypothetical protein